MTDLKQLSALTALNDMMARGHFNICTIDRVAEMLGVNPKCDAYAILHPLHCVNFDKMPVELREAVPGLIQQCLSIAPTYQFKSAPISVQDVVNVPHSEIKPRGLLRLLTR